MRIVAGKFKNKSIAAPAGKRTRPTTDRARETLFNVLAHADWAPPLENARVIDLFAGSGALGLEAISRGAAFCLFVENASGARGVIRENIEAYGLFGNTRIHRRSAVDLGPKPAGLGQPFDLVFVDPPYGEGLVGPALVGLLTGDWLAPSAVAYVETGDDDLPEADGWQLVDTRVVASSRMSFLTRAE